MTKSIFIITIFSFGFINVKCHLSLDWDPPNNAFDQDLYKDVLDPALCQEQLKYMLRNDTLLLGEFLDAGSRIPIGVFMGNTLDMGNYHQCLGIKRASLRTAIEGKYCVLRISLNRNISLINLYRNIFDPITLKWKENNQLSTKYIHRLAGLRGNEGADIHSIRSGLENPLANSVFRVAMCLPKPCTTKEAINGILFNNVDSGLKYDDDFCRLPNDKPWVTGDTIAVVILSTLGLLTVLSTSYDVWHTKIIKKDPNTSNVLLRLFSIYTNTRKVLTLKSSSNSLDCIDGVRALSMVWVILGHSFSSQPFTINSFDVFQWTSSYSAIWIMAGHTAVDSFFMLSGLLVVYTAAGKLSSRQLLKNIHWFYLNRLLRMFPILALTVLLEATLFNHVTDGPFWQTVAGNANRCKAFWWTTLLHVQNYVNAGSVCIGVTWYLAIDVQLHILSPLVLFWVVGRRKLIAWIVLTFTLLGTIAAATTYNFIKEFPSSMMMPNRMNEMMYYMVYYYMNTLTRASPFIVGMMFGYLLHVFKEQHIKISKILNVFLWLCALSVLLLIMYTIHPTVQLDYDNQTMDSVINSFWRPSWALGLGWIIFACVQGYGGPINWFLSLRIWKLPSRLSYALYIMHYSMMVLVNSSRIHPIYFSVESILFKFMGFFSLSMMVAFAATVLVDQPFTNLFKLFLGNGIFLLCAINFKFAISFIEQETSFNNFNTVSAQQMSFKTPIVEESTRKNQPEINIIKPD